MRIERLTTEQVDFTISPAKPGIFTNWLLRNWSKCGVNHQQLGFSTIKHWIFLFGTMRKVMPTVSMAIKALGLYKPTVSWGYNMMWDTEPTIFHIRWMVAKSCTSWKRWLVYPMIYRVEIPSVWWFSDFATIHRFLEVSINQELMGIFGGIFLGIDQDISLCHRHTWSHIGENDQTKNQFEVFFVGPWFWTGHTWNISLFYLCQNNWLLV